MGEVLTRPVGEAVLVCMAEEELADLRRKQGAQVVCHRGRYWEATQPGFYQPIHWLARLGEEQATCPARWHWGFRATLAENASASANGTMPVHLLGDVAGYDVPSLPSKRRSTLRRSQKLATLVAVVGPRLLQEQGYEVVRSALARTAAAPAPPRGRYLAGLATDCAAGGPKLVLAGLLDDRLGGYLIGYAVGATAYIESVYIADQALPISLGTGLVFEFVQACRRSGRIREVVFGQHAREDPGLDLFKEQMGFAVTRVPSKVHLLAPVSGILRRWWPHKYYRLTGHD